MGDLERALCHAENHVPLAIKILAQVRAEEGVQWHPPSWITYGRNSRGDDLEEVSRPKYLTTGSKRAGTRGSNPAKPSSSPLVRLKRWGSVLFDERKETVREVSTSTAASEDSLPYPVRDSIEKQASTPKASPAVDDRG